MVSEWRSIRNISYAIAGLFGVITSKRKPPGYWEYFANFPRELLDYIDQYGTPGVMPTTSDRSSDLSLCWTKQG